MDAPPGTRHSRAPRYREYRAQTLRAGSEDLRTCAYERNNGIWLRA
jgi:hypothetical protein